MSLYNYDPDYNCPPGETLLEVIKDRGISNSKLTSLLDISDDTFTNIVEGVGSITPEIATKLEKILNIPASFWNNLENNYQKGIKEWKENQFLSKKIVADFNKEMGYDD